MSVTLLELRTQARQRTEMESSDFVTDSELNSYINNSLAELYDILVQAYDGEYFIEEHEFATVANQKAYDLPADFYKLKGVDAKINGDDWFKLRKFEFNERNRFEGFSVWNVLGFTSIRYRLRGSKLLFTPVPDTAAQIRLWYVPTPTKLVADGDTFNGYAAWEEYIIVDAAIKMMQKEESDVQVLMLQKEALKRRIEEAANNRDAGDSESVTDIYADNADVFFWRPRG